MHTLPALLLSCLSLAQAGDEKIFSGPQPGEKLTAFKALGFSEPIGIPFQSQFGVRFSF